MSFEASPCPLPHVEILQESLVERSRNPRIYHSASDPHSLRSVAEQLIASTSASASERNSVESGSLSPSNSTRQQRLNDSFQQPRHHHHHPYPPNQRAVRFTLPPQTVPILVSDDVVSGTKRDGWMSPVRRFFCLLVTFDLLFTFLLWIITVLVTGQDVTTAMQQQVLEYTIYSSMFDCVMAAGCRFVISILFYGALDLNHWAPVALTTSGTTIFAVAKVFKYGWTKFGPITFNVFLVIMSFVMSWGELWFLDIRVLPLEMRASELENGYDERSPLIAPPGTLAGSRAGSMIQRFMENGSSLWDGSVANFYSPLETPNDSGDEIEEETLVTVPRRFKRKTPLSQREREYKRKGEDTLAQAWEIINSSDWKLEKRLETSGDTVHSKVVKGKKLFRLEGTVNLPPKLLLEELFYQIESVPTWNPTLIECKTIQPIDSHTDVSYQVCAEAAGGVVSTRDFVNLRHWQMIEGEIFGSCGVSVEHPAMPPQPKKVRGENGPGGWFMCPIPDEPCKCRFLWLLNTDLKGWIPQYVIDSALSGAQFDYIANIRRYGERMRQSGRVSDFLAQQEAAGCASVNSTIATVNSVET